MNPAKILTGLVAIVAALLAVIMTWLLMDVQRTLREFEHRLTVLETSATARTGRTIDLGGFTWTTDRGFDSTPEGVVRVGLEIDILSEQFRWKCGSATEIVRGDAPANLADVIRGYGTDQQLRDAQGIITVGMASTEGLEQGQEKLSRDRIETLVNILQDNLQKPSLPIYGYWLGRYAAGVHDSSCTSQTADQRRVVLLKIIALAKGLSEADIERSVNTILVSRASVRDIIFPFDVRDYSRFRKRESLLIWGRNLQQNK